MVAFEARAVPPCDCFSGTYNMHISPNLLGVYAHRAQFVLLARSSSEMAVESISNSFAPPLIHRIGFELAIREQDHPPCAPRVARRGNAQSPRP